MMMFGMFGFSLIALLLLIAVPVLVIWLIAGGSGFLRRSTQTVSGPQNIQPVYRPATQQNTATATTNRQCANCGAGLQASWTHCPHCGASIS